MLVLLKKSRMYNLAGAPCSKNVLLWLKAKECFITRKFVEIPFTYVIVKVNLTSIMMIVVFWKRFLIRLGAYRFVKSMYDQELVMRRTWRVNSRYQTLYLSLILSRICSSIHRSECSILISATGWNPEK